MASFNKINLVGLNGSIAGWSDTYAEVERRLKANLCSDCGDSLDLQQREPRVDWCAGCRRFWLQKDIAELKACLVRRRTQAQQVAA